MTTPRRAEEQSPPHEEATEADTLEQHAQATAQDEIDTVGGSPQDGPVEAFTDDVTTRTGAPPRVR